LTTKRRRKGTFIANGRDCPRCGHEVGWSPGVKSLWPMTLTCPHCGEGLKYKDIFVVTAVVVALALIISVVAFFITAFIVPYNTGLMGVVVTAIFMVLLWIPAEMLIGKYLRSHKLLVRKNDNSKD